MKVIILTLFSLLFQVNLKAQSFEVPDNYAFETKEDYDTYESDIMRCIDWLKNTPVDEQKAKRKESNAFLLKWLTGSPKVKIEIKPEIVTFMDSGELLMIFMGAWAAYSVESNDYNNKVMGSLAGVEAVIAFYQQNKKALGKSKGVEKYLKMQEKGTLKEYIEENA